jgi:hypothetical protein
VRGFFLNARHQTPGTPDKGDKDDGAVYGNDLVKIDFSLDFPQ